MVAGMVNGSRASVTHRLWAQFPNDKQTKSVSASRADVYLE